MKLSWTIDDRDVLAAQELVAAHAAHPLMRSRRRNVDGSAPLVTLERFWNALVGCLLSTQQRSHVGGRVQRFLVQRPFPLSHEACMELSPLPDRVAAMLSAAGIRRGLTIGKQVAENLEYLGGGSAEELVRAASALRGRDDPRLEREVARALADRLKGIGPKQSRNLLQTLGLTRYEIPIDSRVTRWLNGLGAHPRLGAGALADPSYYEVVLDGVVGLARRAGTYPCLLDAAIFISFEPSGRSVEELTAWDTLLD